MKQVKRISHAWLAALPLTILGGGLILAFMGSAISTHFHFPQRNEINLATGELRRVRGHGEDYWSQDPDMALYWRADFRQYVGRNTEEKWVPLSEDLLLVNTALATVIERGSVDPHCPDNPGLAKEAKVEVIRRTLAMLQTNPDANAAGQYLSEVTIAIWKHKQPLTVTELPDVDSFLKSKYKPGDDSWVPSEG
jgi:hypothetical protein